VPCAGCHKSRPGIGLVAVNGALQGDHHYDCHPCAKCHKSRPGVGLISKGGVWCHHVCH
jgi:hypothetical protein